VFIVGKGEGVIEQELEDSLMKLSQVLIIVSSIGIGVATIPLAFSIMPQELWLLYVAWKVWLFGIAPLVFLYLLSKKQFSEKEDSGAGC
jgi:hypothetical protein